MKTLSGLILLLSIIITGCIPPATCHDTLVEKPQQNPNITINELAEHIKYLASDELKGRYPGTPESKMAQEYLINQFKSANISPFETHGYLQPFDFVNNIVTGKNNKLFIDKTAYTLSEDYIPLGFSANGDLAASTVFVGFGFSISDSIQWNDYEGISIEGKWAIILRGGPDDDNLNSPYNSHLPLRKKVLIAQDNKAAGVIFISQFSDDEDELIPLRYDNSFSGASIPVLHINHTIAERIFAQVDVDLKSLQDSLINTLQPHSIDLPDISITASVDLLKTTAGAANIISYIPGNDIILKNEYIIIGAHYDHLGMGGPGSGSRVPDTLAIHNGADDNASGVAGVVEIGEKLKSVQSELKRSILLMNFDGEERGVLGSKYFTNNPFINLENVIAMLNLDMIGHLEENRLTLGGTGTSPIFEDLLKDIGNNYDLELKFSPEGYGPSDHASFYTKDIPVLFFFTGRHDDYHKPTDDFPIINLQGEKTVSDYVYDIAFRLSRMEERPQFTEAGPKESPEGRRKFKVTFGVIPAFGSEVEGLEIDGVTKGGPADSAGIQKGDIITAIDGKEIKNIYDYMYRLGELKKDSTVPITVLRSEEIIELNIKL